MVRKQCFHPRTLKQSPQLHHEYDYEYVLTLFLIFSTLSEALARSCSSIMLSFCTCTKRSDLSIAERERDEGRDDEREECINIWIDCTVLLDCINIWTPSDTLTLFTQRNERERESEMERVSEQRKGQ